LFQPHATIHWDLADVTYPAQKYFADSIHAGRLPYWTPFLYSGMPFLSDPQTGAWYPLHWPFYLIGITPRMLFWELALHSFLALACFLISQLWKRAALLAVATPVIAFCLSAVVILPWLEIAKVAAHPVTSPAASLRPIALAAVMSADYFGLISGNYRGPEEI